MTTVAEKVESQEKPRVGHLQAKIDVGLFDRLGVLAARRTAQEGRKIYPRDIVEEALTEYLPAQERKLQLAGM